MYTCMGLENKLNQAMDETYDLWTKAQNTEINPNPPKPLIRVDMFLFQL